MFDSKRLSSILKQTKLHGKRLTTELLHEELERRNIQIGLETLKSYRKGNIENPPFFILDEIASISSCTVQDFLSDAEEARQQIALEEINKDPEKYLKHIKEVLTKIKVPSEIMAELEAALEGGK